MIDVKSIREENKDRPKHWRAALSQDQLAELLDVLEAADELANACEEWDALKTPYSVTNALGRYRAAREGK